MTPNELYDRIPDKSSYDLNDLSVGSYGRQLYEIDELGCGYWFPDIKQTDIEIRIYKFFDFDGRRFWKLQSVYYKGNPVMIMRNAGREGDDHCSRFITDKERFKQLICQVKQHILETSDDEEISDIVDGDDDVGVESFYDGTLDGNFERYRY